MSSRTLSQGFVRRLPRCALIAGKFELLMRKGFRLTFCRGVFVYEVAQIKSHGLSGLSKQKACSRRSSRFWIEWCSAQVSVQSLHCQAAPPRQMDKSYFDAEILSLNPPRPPGYVRRLWGQRRPRYCRCHCGCDCYCCYCCRCCSAAAATATVTATPRSSSTTRLLAPEVPTKS